VRKFVIVVSLVVLFFLAGCSSEKAAISIPDQKVNENETLSINLSEYLEKEMDGLVYFLKDGVGRIEGENYEFTPDFTQAGTHEITVGIRTNKGMDTEESFNVTVNDVNRKPVISITDQEMVDGETLKFANIAFDPDGNIASIQASPSNIVDIDEDTNTLVIEATSKKVGEHSVEIIATDSNGKKAVSTFKVNILPKNKLPILSVGDQNVLEGEELKVDLSISAHDPDGGPLEYSIVEGPGEVTSEGIYTLEAKEGSVGSHKVILQVKDEREGITRATFNVHIKAKNPNESKTLIVGGENSLYSSISEAVKNAKPGDLVLVKPGVYNETVVINDAIDVVGSSKEEVRVVGNSNSPTFFVRSGAGFSIKSMTIESPNVAIQVSRESGVIEDCKIISGRLGITYNGDKSDLNIKSCDFSSVEGLESDKKVTDRDFGIYTYGNGILRVSETNFYRNGTALYITGDTQFEITNNMFNDNTIAISLARDSTGKIENNDITKSRDNGILNNSDSVVEFNNNKIYNNVKHGFDLYLSKCTDCGCGGRTFEGTIKGSGNILNEQKEICPIDYSWPENFFIIDETLGS